MSMMLGVCSHGTLKWVPSPTGSSSTPLILSYMIARSPPSTAVRAPKVSLAGRKDCWQWRMNDPCASLHIYGSGDSHHEHTSACTLAGARRDDTTLHIDFHSARPRSAIGTRLHVLRGDLESEIARSLASTSPVYRDVCAMPPPTPTMTANRPTRPKRLAMAVAACCCGVPMPAAANA